MHGTLSLGFGNIMLFFNTFAITFFLRKKKEN